MIGVGGFWLRGDVLGDNRRMDLTQEQINKLEAALARLEALDPADVPEPAAELADLLGTILEESETS
jgi:hypothetical protein